MKKAKYHVISESVEYAKHKHGVHVANFVNAILRKFEREQGKDSTRPLPGIESTFNFTLSTLNLSIAHSFPQWLVDRWIKRFGYDETIKLLATLNSPPEFTIRVNLNKISRDEAIGFLTEKGVKAHRGQFLESAVSVDRLTTVLKNELFKKGLIHIQDEASQLAGASIIAGKGDCILDACAGLGTKTGHLRELFEGAAIVAMDNEIKRLKLISDGKDLVNGDAFNAPFKEQAFSAILLDAPCSSLGIVRKHPEIKWRRKEKDIIAFGNYQLSLLKSLWKHLKTGGQMIYSVCSFEPEETVSVLEAFKKDERFILENALPFLFNKEYFLSLPHKTGMDGFFIARLKKI